MSSVSFNTQNELLNPWLALLSTFGQCLLVVRALQSVGNQSIFNCEEELNSVNNYPNQAKCAVSSFLCKILTPFKNEILAHTSSVSIFSA